MTRDPVQRVPEGIPRLALTDVRKSFGAVTALRRADLAVMPGEVHALVGENGAGKSTLIKIVSGAESMDSGSMEIDGEPAVIRTVAEALSVGIATVYQDAKLFSQLTVAENIFMGREVLASRRIDWHAQNERVAPLLAQVGLGPECAMAPVEELSAAQAQQVAIAKALSTEARVLILDEPSAILTSAEVEVLYEAIRRLTADGVSVIYITHRLDEVFEIADAVTVMRDGRTLGTFDVGQLDLPTVAEMVVGDRLESAPPGRRRNVGEPTLVLDELDSGERVHDVSVTVRSGEAVVLYGLVGSGVAEISKAIYGMRPITGGRLFLHGHPVHPRSAADAQRLGIAMLPGDRNQEGLFSFQSVAFNMSVSHLPVVSRGRVWVDTAKELAVSTDIIRRLAIKTPSEAVPVSSLSGGNAQKVVLGRQLVERPSVLVLAEPTQGVDVGAKEELHRIIHDLCDQGTAILVVTSDLSEATRIADRLIVIRDGTAFAEFGPGAKQSDILAAASGVLADAVAAVRHEEVGEQ